jgi:hypothetical protein
VATFKAVADFLSTGLGSTFGTIKLHGGNLRKAGILPPSKRGFGALALDTRNAIDLSLSVLLAPTNLEAVETVQTMRSRHMTSAHFNPLSLDTPAEGRVRAAFNSVRDIGIHFVGPLNVSAVLCAIVDSMRSGAFDKWAEGDGHVTVDFHDNGRGTLIYFDRHAVNEAAVFSFDADKNAPRPPVERMIRINDQVLRALAEALGPLPSRPETAIPPPPY